MAIKTVDQANPSKQAAVLPLARKRAHVFVGLGLALVVTVLAVSTVGSSYIPLSDVAGVVLSRLHLFRIPVTWPPVTETIVLDIRLPRILLAGIVGGALALAGATYQGLFRNPLADPYLIGVAQGAALGATIGILLPWPVFGMGLAPLLAFAGAVAAVAAVYLLARVGRTLPTATLVLAGVALGSFLASITSYLALTSGDKVHGVIAWLLGRLSLGDWSQVMTVAPYVLVGSVVICLFARPLNIMQLDEEQAQQLGINVERVKLVLLGAATLITAAAVSFCGTIGFVGLIVPHAVRMLWGPDHRQLLPLCALSGAIFLILADTAARTVMSPAEMPVGVITAFLGAPFFLYLLRRKRRNLQ